MLIKSFYFSKSVICSKYENFFNYFDVSFPTVIVFTNIHSTNVLNINILAY